MQDPKAFADGLDAERFWQDIQDVAAIGALEPHGVRRLALDDADNRARLWLAEQGKALGCEVAYDPVGNVFVRREGTDPSLPPLVIGSHLDSQPRAGAYDGALGVIAALSVLRGLDDHAITHSRPVEVVSWTNEEGARFAPGTAGSAWYTGARGYEAIATVTDADGIRCGDALADCQSLMNANGLIFRDKPLPPAGYLELHIEQGPVLEKAGIPVAAVSGIQGVNWYAVAVHGKANHAGTTPRALRADAMDGAQQIIGAMRDAVYDLGRDDVRFTIGRFELQPGAVNTIPDHASFTIDLRHPDAQVLAAIDQRLGELASQRWSACTVVLERTSAVSPVTFDTATVEALEAAAGAFADAPPTLMSGAFHDAVFLARVCPTGMLFCPCRGGLSHHPDEHVERADAVAAMRALGMATAHQLDSLLCP